MSDSDDDNMDRHLKLVLLGDTCVGKVKLLYLNIIAHSFYLGKHWLSKLTIICFNSSVAWCISHLYSMPCSTRYTKTPLFSD